MVLIGPQPEIAGGIEVQPIHTIEQVLNLFPAQPTQLPSAQAQVLGQAEQRPGMAEHAVAGTVAGGALLPGPDQLCQVLPLRPLALLAPSAVALLHQALSPAGQELRQALVEQGVAHHEFGRAMAHLPAQQFQTRLYTPFGGAQAQGKQALQHQAYRQVIQHFHRLILALVTGIQVPPESHAGPTRQLQGQTFQVTGPALPGQIQALQLLDDGVQGIVRQFVAMGQPVGQSLQGPTGQVAAVVAPAPVETLGALPGMPGRHALVEKQRQLANQVRTQLVQQVRAGQGLKQATQSEIAAHPLQQLIDLFPGRPL